MIPAQYQVKKHGRNKSNSLSNGWQILTDGNIRTGKSKT